MVAVWVATDCRCGRSAQRYPPGGRRSHRAAPLSCGPSTHRLIESQQETPPCMLGSAPNPQAFRRLPGPNCPPPPPQAGEVLIEIRAASLNFPDLLIVQNKYQKKPPLPFVPGSEYAGVVAAVGAGVTQLKPGQNVACLSGTGGFGTHAIAAAELCLPLPDGFSHVDAAALIMTYATSHHALADRAQLQAGETVLVLGAAGGV